MANNPHTIRINPDKERELHLFFKERGFKAGVKFLFDFYQQNQNLVDEIVGRLKEEVSFSKPQSTAINLKKKAPSGFNHSDNFTNVF